MRKRFPSEKEEYFLGALADSHLDKERNELQIYQKNVGWLQMMNALLFEIFGLKGRIYKRDVYWLRKRNKNMMKRILELQTLPISDGKCFVAGLFDAEGSVYTSTSSKIPVLDITQCERGLESLHVSQRVLSNVGIMSHLNGPYQHKYGKIPQYHLRIYGKRFSQRFLELIPIKHVEKRNKLSRLLEKAWTPHSDSLKVA